MLRSCFVNLVLSVSVTGSLFGQNFCREIVNMGTLSVQEFFFFFNLRMLVE